MGPRSDERGNGQSPKTVPAFALASMGPRSDERGNCGGSRKSTARCCTLQWGSCQNL